MTKNEYNGWTNYETWNAKMWMDNDQGSYKYWREAAAEVYRTAVRDNTFTREENARLELAEQLKQHFEDAAEEWMPDQDSFFADMLNASLSEVNWHEIARSLLDDAIERAA